MALRKIVFFNDNTKNEETLFLSISYEINVFKKF